MRWLLPRAWRETADVALEKRAARAVNTHAGSRQDSSRRTLDGLRELVAGSIVSDDDDDDDVHFHPPELGIAPAGAKGHLDSAEFEQYLSVGQLPEERNRHLTNCARCQKIVASAKVSPEAAAVAAVRLANAGDSDFLEMQRKRRELRLRQEATIEQNLFEKRLLQQNEKSRVKSKQRKATVLGGLPSSLEPALIRVGQPLIGWASGVMTALLVYAVVLNRPGSASLFLPPSAPASGHLVDKTGGEIGAFLAQPRSSQEVFVVGELKGDSSNPTLEVVQLGPAPPRVESKAAAKGEF
jgi:hypothetical protein